VNRYKRTKKNLCLQVNGAMVGYVQCGKCGATVPNEAYLSMDNTAKGPELPVDALTPTEAALQRT
jgi:hypothetical protein